MIVKIMTVSQAHTSPRTKKDKHIDKQTEYNNLAGMTRLCLSFLSGFRKTRYRPESGEVEKNSVGPEVSPEVLLMNHNS